MNRLDLLLSCLSEECGEVIQAVGKAHRFGINDRHPTENITNEQLIWKEVHDIVGVFMCVLEELDLDSDICWDTVTKKQEKVDEYLELSEELGRLDKELPRITTGALDANNQDS